MPGPDPRRHGRAGSPAPSRGSEPSTSRGTSERLPPAVRRRDQRWALHAYGVVETVSPLERESYEIVVNGLGADILRNGLSVALATLERQAGPRGRTLLEHLASAGVTGLAGSDGAQLPARVRGLPVDKYMLATRELLQLAAWLKRACQAHHA
jgi:CRISPR-associated protein Cmr5